MDLLVDRDEGSIPRRQRIRRLHQRAFLTMTIDLIRSIKVPDNGIEVGPESPFSSNSRSQQKARARGLSSHKGKFSALHLGKRTIPYIAPIQSRCLCFFPVVFFFHQSRRVTSRITLTWLTFSDPRIFSDLFLDADLTAGMFQERRVH